MRKESCASAHTHTQKMPKCFIYSGSALAVKLVHRHSTFNNLKQTIETNLAGYESQLA